MAKTPKHHEKCWDTEFGWSCVRQCPVHQEKVAYRRGLKAAKELNKLNSKPRVLKVKA